MLSDDEKIVLQQDYTHKIEDVLLRIEQQQKAIDVITKQELLWRGAKILGGVALMGLLMYNLFTAPQVSKKEEQIQLIPQEALKQESILPIAQQISKQEPIKQPLLLVQPQSPPIDKNFELPLHEEQKPPNTFESTQSLSTTQSQEIPIPIKEAKIPLAPQEKALYELRYKNLRTASVVSFFPLIIGLLVPGGPVAWPIDAAILALSLVSGMGAVHYKTELNQDMNQ